LESSYFYLVKKYKLSEDMLSNNEIGFTYVNTHFEEKDKLPFLELLYVDAFIQYRINVIKVDKYKDDIQQKKQLVEASLNLVWYYHAIFLRCIWCEQYALSKLDYDTKKVRVKDSIQKVEAFMLEQEFKDCPKELLKDFEFIKRWLKTHTKSLKGIDRDTYNQKVVDKSYNKVEKPKKKVVKKRNVKQDIQTAISYIKFLSGENYKRENIMKDEEYQQLVKYVTYMVKHESLPENIKSIPQINTSNNNLRYTFYLIHKKLYTTNKKRPYFIDFLHKVFDQFHNTNRETTNTKFSVKPDQYENDVG